MLLGPAHFPEEVAGVKAIQASGIGQERSAQMAVADGREAREEPLIKEEVEANILRLRECQHRRREVGITQGTQAGEHAWVPQDVRMWTELRVLDELREL